MDRRNFLKGAALVGAGALGAGALAACSPSTTSASDGSASSGSADAAGAGASTSSWKTPQDFSAQATDAGTYDVVVVGHGYAGVCACRELAESGHTVALLEFQPEDGYAASGNESCGINSKLVNRITEGNQYHDVDPVEYYQNWMTMIGNQGNPGLIMKFCQKMGENTDWYYDSLTDADIATLTHNASPAAGESWPHLLPSIGPIKFWPGVISAYAEECNQTKIQGYNRQKAEAAGAEFFFNTRGLQILKDSSGVSGVVAQSRDDDSYLTFTSKAVIVATGGFAYNEEMLNDLMPDIKNNMTEGEVWDDAFGGERFTGDVSTMQYQGDGIKMAHWAGAHLETLVAGMNSKHIQAPQSMNNFPQAVWVRSDGKRFLNEFYPIVEQRGVPNVYMQREPIHCVFDSNFIEYRQYVVPQHGMFSPTPANIDGVREAMDKAYQVFKGTWVEPESSGEEDPMMAMFAAPDYIADDTLEGLAGQLGLSGDAVTDFVAEIAKYNAYCDNGLDEDFGRDKEVLFPVREGPFYALSGNPGLGEIMCTMGGIITDSNQNALDQDFVPIPGLYVSGNDCGRRFGLEYITPTPGVSLCIAYTLGRECGKSVAQWLKSA
ncbi:MAG: FAD-dependent oxidoreductase [Coriobacteriales bacterium]|nr:FAD-dependent oxidoreductase [Coriobacteriales bacterium]